MAVRIRVGHVYAWDPSRQDPDNPQALVYVCPDPFELKDVDSPAPLLGYGQDWSARNGMLGVEMFGDTLNAYESAVLDADDARHRYVNEAMEFAEEVLGRLSEACFGDFVEVPSAEDFRLVTFRSAEVNQSYPGWLWLRSTSGEALR